MENIDNETGTAAERGRNTYGVANTVIGCIGLALTVATLKETRRHNQWIEDRAKQTDIDMVQATTA